MPRVSLHPVNQADGPALIAAHRRNRRHHAPWAEPCADQAGFDAWFTRLQNGPNESRIARDSLTGGIIGMFNLSQIAHGNFCSAYLGFYGMVEFAGQGLMTEALMQMVDYAFTDVGLHRLEANIQPANTRSIALVRRAGFQQEGYSPKYLFIDGAWRDHERWARIADT